MIDDLMQRENYVLAKKLLDVSHAKQNAIASNLANVETPGYKRMDIETSFDAQLKRAAATNDVNEIRNLEFRTVRDLESPNQRADGNNVQIDQEMLAMQKNAIQYEFLANYTSTSLNRLKTAISGRV
ncbi:flagellar basal body rod protein FlgB [Pelagicoccus sp. NFK12]|uniref:Flagellar basal body rod protein FlgB n=1 Tax=Pelagicoccus enzymogenes TaxID=2773457 RepID=A0A927F585_9BACT|nr:flagellar basal body rod protein FlgB [Pelagicoccus enzymogenes]MBD5778682.1 flagellar basal body rod protein FlgB [Pelagicoccus enzymogenes]MDQ8196946.1 flagellar basal body rod protein FlgB [Pelagicoccus enzymogenes]